MSLALLSDATAARRIASGGMATLRGGGARSPAAGSPRTHCLLDSDHDFLVERARCLCDEDKVADCGYSPVKRRSASRDSRMSPFSLERASVGDATFCSAAALGPTWPGSPAAPGLESPARTEGGLDFSPILRRRPSAFIAEEIAPLGSEGEGTSRPSAARLSSPKVALRAGAAPAKSGGRASVLADMERLQHEANDLLQERRSALAASQRRSALLARRSRELGIAQERRLRLAAEEEGLLEQVSYAERRATDAERDNATLQQAVEELRMRFAHAELAVGHLEEELVQATAAARGAQATEAELERRVRAGPEPGVGQEALYRVEEQLQRATSELGEAQAWSRREVDVLESALDADWGRHAECEGMLRRHLTEQRASFSELQRLREALTARSAEFVPLEADAAAAKAALQHAAAREDEIVQAQREVKDEALAARAHSEVRAQVQAALCHVEAHRRDVASASQMEISTMAQLQAAERSHQAEARRAQAASRALANAHAAHERNLVSHEGSLEAVEAAAALEKSELEAELGRVHREVASSTQELQALAEELPAAKLVLERQRRCRDHAKTHVQLLAGDLEAQEANIEQEEAGVREALGTRCVLDEAAASAATAHDARIDELNCQCHAIELRVAALGRRGADLAVVPASEAALLEGLAKQLRASLAALRITEERQRDALVREEMTLESRAAELVQLRDIALARAREAAQVRIAVAAETNRAASASRDALEASSARAVDMECRSECLGREASELRAEIGELREVETRLGALNVGLQRQVCLLREGGHRPRVSHR